MRARRQLASEWELPFDKRASFFFNAKGLCLASSVWRQSMRTLVEAACNRFVLEVQAGLRMAFDHVSRSELWAQGQAEGYPLPILSLAASAYAWPIRLEHNRASIGLPIP